MMRGNPSMPHDIALLCKPDNHFLLAPSSVNLNYPALNKENTLYSFAFGDKLLTFPQLDSCSIYRYFPVPVFQRVHAQETVLVAIKRFCSHSKRPILSR